MVFDSEASFHAPGYLCGHVYDVETPGLRWAVGLFHNDRLTGTCFADLAVLSSAAQQTEAEVSYVCAAASEDATALGSVPPDCRFEFNINTSLLKAGDRLSLKVLNTGHVIADQLLDEDMDIWRDTAAGVAAGHVRHVNGLTLSGHLNDAVTEHPSYEILAYDGDHIVGRTRVFRWQHIGDPRSAHGRRVGFDLLIDPDLADGLPRKLRVETSTGQPIEGSPLHFVAYPNSLRTPWLSAEGRRRNRMSDMALDRILENSAPLSAYGEHYPELRDITSQTSLSKSLPLQPFCPDGNLWHLPGSNWTLIANKAVTPRADLGDLLAELPDPAAIGDADLGPTLVYFDLATRKGDDIYPLLFPAFDLERLLEQGYAALCFAAPRDQVEALLEYTPRSAFEMFLDLLAQEPDQILHIPHPGGLLEEDQLADTRALHVPVLREHLPDLAPEAQLAAAQKKTLLPAAHLQRRVTDRAVSVIIPTRDEGQMLAECIDSLRQQNPGFDLDILVVDNGSQEAETEAVFCELEAAGVRILEYDDGFNFSQINNLAAEHARHEQICFLNNDVIFHTEGALEELCSRLSDPTVGAVGPLMMRASDIIQHGGVALGPSNGALHLFEDRMRGDPGYGEMLLVARECSAVTGAVLLTRKSLFDQLGGFEETLFAVNFNDVDYCLRLRAAGLRVMFTPHASVLHFESVSRGREQATPAGARMQREVHNLRLRWRDTILNDPFTHPLLSTDTLPYRALCTRHRAPAPRTSKVAPSADLPRWI